MCLCHLYFKVNEHAFSAITIRLFRCSIGVGFVKGIKGALFEDLITGMQNLVELSLCTVITVGECPRICSNITLCKAIQVQRNDTSPTVKQVLIG